MNPCPPQCPSCAAEDHPLPPSCGPIRSRLKWRRHPVPRRQQLLCDPARPPKGFGVTGRKREPGARPLPSQPGRREAGRPARSQPRSWGCSGPCSALRSDGFHAPLSPSPPGAFCLSASRTGRLRVEPRGSALRAAAPGLCRRHRRSSSGLPPGWSLGAFMFINGFTGQ